VADLPPETLQFLLSSRYCEVDLLSNTAAQLFGGLPPGWQRVQAICDWVHQNVTFGYEFASADQNRARRLPGPHRRVPGLPAPRDHLLPVSEHPSALRYRIPGRHLRSGYRPLPSWTSAPGSRSTWKTAGGRSMRETMTPRVGRVLMATGRDATDVAITTSFGNALLAHFEITTDEVTEQREGAGG
jgi:hypothetical protein